MKIDYCSTDKYGNLIITVLAYDDLFEVVNTLEFIEKFLCKSLDYNVDFENKEVCVDIDDYYSFLSLRRLLLDHCALAA